MVTDLQISRVKQALQMFAADGSIKKAVAAVGLAGGYFYNVLRADPAIKAEYERIKRDRAEIMLAEAYEISTDNTADPRRARVQADIRVKLAALFAPEAYGDRLQLEVSAKPSLAAALDRKFRAIVPGATYEQVAQAQDAEFTALPAPRAPDKVSVDAPSEAPVTYASLFDD